LGVARVAARDPENESPAGLGAVNSGDGELVYAHRAWRHGSRVRTACAASIPARVEAFTARVHGQPEIALKRRAAAACVHFIERGFEC
jgi:hypothetical protein